MPKALIFYHYFHPDDVASARHLTDLAQGLVRRGWEVTAMPSNSGCRDESRSYSRREEHGWTARTDPRAGLELAYRDFKEKTVREALEPALT